MATLYWGGGTGTWDGFDNTHWYTDVGRTTLSDRAPSAEDDVVFDSASNATAYTVTISGSTTVCRDVTIAGPASGNLTLAGIGNWYIYGSLSFPATGLTRTFTSLIQFWGTGSHTITTNGVALSSPILFNGGGTYTLQDALTAGSSNLQINTGVVNTNDKTLSCGTITSSITVGALNLGASTVSATNISANSPLIINAGTSNITLSASNAGIGGGVDYTGNTFYNVTFSSAAVTTLNLYGNNTFNNLTFTTKSAAGVSNVVLYGNQTVNGTLTITGQSSVNRYFVRSNIVGTDRTMTVGTVATLADVDFRDITVAGTSSPWSGTRLGDCGGNTNLTFPAAKTVYWNQVAGGNWYATAWATSSGGTPDVNNFPLAQDTAILDNAGLNTNASISNLSGYNVGTLTSTRTNGSTLNGALTIYGDLNSTSTGGAAFNPAFAGRVTQNFTSGGSINNNITLNGYNASVKLADNLTVAGLIITSGGLDTNNKSLTITTGITVSINNTGPFSLTLGSSAVSIAGSNTLSSSSSAAPSMTVNAGTSTITLTNGSAIFGFAGQTLTWYNVTRSSASSGGIFYGDNTFNNLTFTAPTTTGVANLLLSGNQTVNGTLALGGGTSVTQRLGFISNTIGTQRTITAAAVTGLTDIDFRDINATGAADWTTGTRLGDCGGNTGITFPAAKSVYWNLAGTQNWSATAWATGSGGTPDINNFPLAQDTAVFDDTGSVGTVTINAAWNIGTINAGGRTSAWILAGSGAPAIYGDIVYGSGITTTIAAGYSFSGRGLQTYTTAGKTVTNFFSVRKPSGTLQHGDAYTSSSGNVTQVTLGNYATQNYNISCLGINSNNSDTRSITLGTSVLTLSESTAINFLNPTNLTFSGASSTINLTATTVKNFNGGGQAFGTVSSTGGTTNLLLISGSNTFGALTNSAFTYLMFVSGTTQTVTNFTYSGASGNVVRWSAQTPGQRATIKTASSAVGANSIDGGNNNGLTFTGTSPNYFYVKDIKYSPFSSFNTSNFFAFF